jgi:hypothetical protein
MNSSILVCHELRSFEMAVKLPKKPLAFISYIHEDADFADSLRSWISAALLGSLESFVAGDEDSIPPGTQWLNRISAALQGCAVALLVLSPKSAERKWIYFEAGAASARDVPVIPICCKGMTKADLTPPLSTFQAVELPDRADELSVLKQLARICGLNPPQTPQPFLPAVMIPEVMEFSKSLEGAAAYAKWRFRINWPMAEGATRIDAYSPEIDWKQLLNALSSQPVATHEVASVFRALSRAVTKNAHPPRKLSGTILFQEASKRTLEAAQQRLGSTPYERISDAHHENDELEGSYGGILPVDYLAPSENLKAYTESQTRVALVVSSVCKYAKCSTYQIAISKGISLAKSPEGFRLAVACTARNTNKEVLAVVAEVPVFVFANEGPPKWYGQLNRPPTSEHRARCAYHRLMFERHCERTLMVHFHPIELLELFSKLKAGQQRRSAPAGAWRGAEQIAQDLGIALQVLDKFEEVRARDAAFGEFMAEVAVRAEAARPAIIVWKPNHGVWMLINEDATEEQIRAAIVSLETLAGALEARLNERADET